MKKTGILLMLLLVAVIARAELVDDFESYTTGPVSTVITDGSWVTDPTDDDVVIEVDPADPANKVMSTVEAGGTGGAGQTGTYAVLTGQTEIPDGVTKTLFLRFRVNTAATDQAIGLTSIDTPTLHGSGDWNEFHACFRFTNGNIDVRDGGTWLTTLQNRALTVNTWYNLWFVVNNAAGTANDTVQMYLTTAPGVDATEADRMTTGTTDTFGFRVPQATTLDRIYWRAQDGSEPLDKVFIDDVHISPGVDLSFPSSKRPYEPAVIQEAPVGGQIPTTLTWKAGLDPDGVYAVNPDIVDQYVFMSPGTPADPNLYYVGATSVDESTWSLTDPSSEYSLNRDLDATYYWAVVEALTGYEQAFTVGDSINQVDPNNIVGPTWSYESSKSIPIITAQPADARVFDTDPQATFTVAFSSVNPVTATWYKDDVALVPGGDIAVTTTDVESTLTISTPTLSDEAKYYAVLSVDEQATDDDVQTATRLLVIKQLLAQYDFEQNLADSSANGAPTGQGLSLDTADPNEMQAVNASLTYVSGIDGDAVYLDGSQVVDFTTEGYPKAGPLDTFGDARGEGYEKSGWGRGMETGSIVCWVKPESTGAVYMNANAGEDSTHFGLTTPGENNIRMIMRGENWDGSYQEIATAAGGLNMTDFSLQDGYWHMFAATWENDTVRVFINGEQVASATAGVPEVYNPWERPNLLGASRTAGARQILNSFYTGAVDSLRVYNYVLSNDEIAQEYAAMNERGLIPCVDHAFAGSEYNFDNTVNSYCKIDLNDFAVIAQNWLTSGLYTP